MEVARGMGNLPAEKQTPILCVMQATAGLLLQVSYNTACDVTCFVYKLPQSVAIQP